jgi:hypothetical protein
VAEPVHQDEMPPLAAVLSVHFLCPICLFGYVLC